MSPHDHVINAEHTTKKTKTNTETEKATLRMRLCSVLAVAGAGTPSLLLGSVTQETQEVISATNITNGETFPRKYHFGLKSKPSVSFPTPNTPAGEAKVKLLATGKVFTLCVDDALHATNLSKGNRAAGLALPRQGRLGLSACRGPCGSSPGRGGQKRDKPGSPAVGSRCGRGGEERFGLWTPRNRCGRSVGLRSTFPQSERCTMLCCLLGLEEPRLAALPRLCSPPYQEQLCLQALPGSGSETQGN